jgi:signal transduction histidine kinase
MKMDVSWISGRLPEGDRLVHERTKSLLTHIDSAILAIQRISTALRPVALDDFGLNEALRITADDFEKRTKIICDIVSESPEITLEKEIATGVFRIFQEALTNVARHARARRVTVFLQKKGNELIMEVTDDGRGITKKEATDLKSIGLTALYERALAIGGALTVTGIRNKGTKIVLKVLLSGERNIVENVDLTPRILKERP